MSNDSDIGSFNYDADEEVPGMIAEALIEYPTLKPLWRSLLEAGAEVRFWGYRTGDEYCAVSATRPIRCAPLS